MKGIVGIILILGVCAFFLSRYLTGEVMGDQGHPLAVAWGAATEDTLEMQIGVPPLFPLADPPEFNERNIEKWSEWIDKHFQMHDEAGQVIPLRRIGTSALFVGEVAAGVPEFVLCVDLKKGGRYSCDFVPILAKGKRYRYSFNVPTESQKVGRRTFELVNEKG